MSVVREVVLFAGVLWLAGNMSMPHVQPQPQAILVLGGEPIREQFAAQFAKQHPDLPVFVSSGSPREYAEYVFQQGGIDLRRVHLDYRAVDTVTNFTTMVPVLHQRGIRKVYLLTSDFHMPRAQAIARIVLGGQGIEFEPVAIPSSHRPEAGWKILRDTLRSTLWLGLGGHFR